MREEDATPEQEVRFAARQLLKAVQEGLIDGFSAELIDELFVIDCYLITQEKKRGKRGKRRKGKRSDSQ